MKSLLSWQGVGQFVALLVDLSILVRDTFSHLRVGMEIIPWVISKEGGRAILVSKLKEIVHEYLNQTWVRVIDKNTIEVNMGLNPQKYKFEHFGVQCHQGDGWVKIQKRSDGQLYYGDEKIHLCLDPRDGGGDNDPFSVGYKVRHRLSGYCCGNAGLNISLLDALLEHQHLIPEDWKGKKVFFMATGFSDFFGAISVKYLFYDDREEKKEWRKGEKSLTETWDEDSPSAVPDEWRSRWMEHVR